MKVVSAQLSEWSSAPLANTITQSSTYSSIYLCNELLHFAFVSSYITFLFLVLIRFSTLLNLITLSLILSLAPSIQSFQPPSQVISRVELQMFLEFAPAYFEYMAKAFYNNIPTVLCKILGVYTLGFHNKETGKKVHPAIFCLFVLHYISFLIATTFSLLSFFFVSTLTAFCLLFNKIYFYIISS